jgi:hypothetical protein
MSFARIAFLAGVMLVVGLPGNAAAEGDSELSRLEAAGGKTLKWNWTPPGQSDSHGHAERIVRASPAQVIARIQDYGSYQSFAPWRFKTSRVVGHEGPATDVYLQFSALKGLVTLWNVTRFQPPRSAGPGVEVIEGRFVKGNVKDVHVVWTVRGVGAGKTILKCDILLKPDLPAPQSALDEELRDAAQQAVDGASAKAEKAAGTLASQ